MNADVRENTLNESGIQVQKNSRFWNYFPNYSHITISAFHVRAVFSALILGFTPITEKGTVIAYIAREEFLLCSNHPFSNWHSERSY